jgi:hypothetical protein
MEMSVVPHFDINWNELDQRILTAQIEQLQYKCYYLPCLSGLFYCLYNKSPSLHYM